MRVRTRGPTERKKPSLWLIRHGETEWARLGKHTGRTDIPLTELGREQASGVAGRLAHHDFAQVLSSPLSRALDTARLAGKLPYHTILGAISA